MAGGTTCNHGQHRAPALDPYLEINMSRSWREAPVGIRQVKKSIAQTHMHIDITTDILV